MFLVGSNSTNVSSTLSIVNLIIGIPIAIISVQFTSIAISMTTEVISKLKARYTKLINWINVNNSIYEKTWKQSMTKKEVDEKEAQEIKFIYNQYLDKRSRRMRNT